MTYHCYTFYGKNRRIAFIAGHGSAIGGGGLQKTTVKQPKDCCEDSQIAAEALARGVAGLKRKVTEKMWRRALEPSERDDGHEDHACVPSVCVLYGAAGGGGGGGLRRRRRRRR